MTLTQRLTFPLLAVSFFGCADLSKYTKQGADLAAEFGPQVQSLLEGNKQQQARAAQVPDSTEGKTDVLAGLAQNNDLLSGLKGGLDNLPGKLETLVAGGDVGAVTAFLGEQRQTTTQGIAKGTDALKGLTGQVGGLEAKAAALKAAPVPVAAPVAPPPPPSYSRALATGFTVEGAPDGLEQQLVAFIEDAGRPADKTTWFRFDRVSFKTGSAEVDMDQSKAQLTNLAEILKAYPKVTLKVGGYTDNQGAAATNKKLSADRATNVAKAVTAMKVAAQRLAPEGYGPEHPVCPANDTDACRAQNRRIAVRVSAK